MSEDMRLYEVNKDSCRGEVFCICFDSRHYEFIAKNNRLQEVIVIGKCNGKCGSKSYPLPEYIFKKEDTI